MSLAVSLRDVTKKFQLYDSPQQRLKEAFHPFRKKYHRDFYAIESVSFDVRKGETVGIVGRNGSGKSTLLQIICGILQPSSGSVATQGRISALLELGSGFNPEFSGRSNVTLHGALVGLSRRQIEERMGAIESFAEIGDFIDQPMKTYSTGMFLRLAFSCAIHIQPEILVVDEALSVGDVFFQQKCYAKIREVIAGGTTCLFVSHDTQAVMKLCNRAILLEEGKLTFEGDPRQTISRYFAAMGKRAPNSGPQIGALGEEDNEQEFMDPAEIIAHNILPPSSRRHGAGGLRILAARVTDASEIDTLEVSMLEPLTVQMLLRAREAVHAPNVGIHLFDRFGNLVFASGTKQCNVRLPDLSESEELVVRLRLSFHVRPGEYTFSLGAGEPAQDDENIGYLHDRLEMLGPIVVRAIDHGMPPFYGIAGLPFSAAFRCTSSG